MVREKGGFGFRDARGAAENRDFLRDFADWAAGVPARLSLRTCSSRNCHWVQRLMAMTNLPTVPGVRNETIE